MLAPDRAAPAAAELARALTRAGHEAAVLRPRALPAAPLALRKIGDELERFPGALLALHEGGFDAAHALSPTLACAAIVWARRTGRPAALTVLEPPRRDTLAARRLRLATWRRAVGHGRVAAATPEAAAALRRWLAVDAPVVAPGDAAGNLALYV